MKVTLYVKNFLTHHYLPLSLELHKRLGDDFKFVSNKKIFDWRLNLGFEDLDKKYEDFVIRSYESDEEYEKAKKLAEESDVVIVGETTSDFIEERLKKDKLTFRYSYRILLFRDGFFKTIFDKEKWKLFYKMHLKPRKNKNLHLLCINGYAAKEFNALGLYKDKAFKWGYFIETEHYDIDKLIEEKEKNEKIQIIWVARFINWKHPELVLKLARNLKKQNYNFKIQMLGTGKLEEKIRNRIIKEKLDDVIEVVGKVPSSEVQGYMQKANIFIGTSDSREGWGATINEAMNSGCAIVANKNIGSVPFLIGDNDTGFMYKNYSDFENKVKQLIDDKDLRIKFSKNAYNYVTNKWNASLAAENIIELCNSIINGKESKIDNGPGSKN